MIRKVTLRRFKRFEEVTFDVRGHVVLAGPNNCGKTTLLYPPAFLADPLRDAQFLIGTKARTHLLPPALDAAGLPDVPYTRYHEIAALMLPEEIHPEIKEKLDLIQKAFGL